MSAIAQRQLVAFVDLQSNRYAMIKSGEIRVILPYRAGLRRRCLRWSQGCL